MRQGSDAEDRAADYLLGCGYTIVTRRYVARGGEIDLVALDGDTLVFVEVKQRTTASPEEMVGSLKISRLVSAAQQYVLATGDKREIRYDVIAIDLNGLRHHVDAFQA